MKLLYITNGINGAGGLERVLSVKASYLAEHYNYDVTILSLNNNDSDPFYLFSNKIKFVSINVSGNVLKYSSAYIKGIREQVNSIQPDSICVCDDGLKAFFIPQFLKTNASIIYERHVSKEIEMNENFNFFKKISIKIKWMLMNWLAPYFSSFIVLTNGNVNEWKSLKNTQVIPNPLSFYPEQASTLQNKKVIAVGKQGYQKGYDLLLKAWQKVALDKQDWQLEIYGKFDPKEKLNELANQLGISESVVFFPPTQQIEEKYLNASLFVLSSRFEGFGMVIIEAMACGVPCVSFDCPHGPADIISHGEDGLLVPNEDAEQLADALIEIIEHEQRRQAMGVAAKENVKRYLPEHIMPLWDGLFKKLVNENRL
jgi:glycosyltransferase involved in cell wall biosynthesis